MLEKGLDAGTAYEILSIDIADIDVGDNIGANLQALQAEADTRVARAKAEERRAFAVAKEQEMQAAVQENRAKVVAGRGRDPHGDRRGLPQGTPRNRRLLQPPQRSGRHRNAKLDRRHRQRSPREHPGTSLNEPPRARKRHHDSDSDFAGNSRSLGADFAAQPRDAAPAGPGPARPRPERGTATVARSKFAEADPRTAAALRLSSARRSPRSLATSRSQSDPRFASSPARRGASQPARRSGSRPPPRPAEPAAGRRRLSSQINQSMAQAANRPLEITPLEIPLSSLSSTLMPLGSRAALEPSSFQAVAPALDAKTVRAMLRSPEKLREIAILSELLKPPLALRPGADRTEHRRFARFCRRRALRSSRLGSSECRSQADVTVEKKADFRSTANGLARSVIFRVASPGKECAALRRDPSLTTASVTRR